MSRFRCAVMAVSVSCMLFFFENAVNAVDGWPDAREYRSAIQEYGKPLGFRDADGRITGFSVEVMEAIAQRAGITVRHSVVATYADLLALFQSGTVDMTPSVAISPDRAKFFDFTSPYETIPLLVFVRADDPRHALQPGMTVGAVTASAAVGYLRNVPDITLQLYPGYPDVITALLERKIDAFAASAERVHEMITSSGIDQRIKTVGHPVGVVQRAIAVKKGNTVLRDRLDAAVKEFLASSEYRRIHEKWFGVGRN